MKNDTVGFLMLLGIVAIALHGGSTANRENVQNDVIDVRQTNQNTKTVAEIEKQVLELKKQIQAEEDKVNQSQYKDIVTLSYLNKSSSPDKEYIAIRVDNKATKAIYVTGWTLKSTAGDLAVKIPKGNYLFFLGTPNSEEDIILEAKDVLYLITGYSPIGVSFKTNICSGYLGQFQTFVPYLQNNCPSPRDEDLSSIPDIAINYDCLDYIESFPRCTTQTKDIPVKWSAECKNFIYEKINYSSCINTHKNDPGFYKNEWRVYLKRSESVWNSRRTQTITLYDNEGKIVDTLESY